MGYCKCIMFLFGVMFVLNTFVIAGSDKIEEILSKKSDITQKEKKQIKKKYYIAQEEKLYADIIYDFVSEGFVKEYSIQEIINTIDNRIIQLRQTKQFCQQTNSDNLKVPHTYENTKIFIFALTNNVLWGDIRYSYETANFNNYTLDNYLELVKEQAVLSRKNISGGYVRKMLSKAQRYGMPFKHVYKLMQIVEKNPDEFSRKVVLDAMNQNTNFYEIEDRIQSHNDQKNIGTSGSMRKFRGEMDESVKRGRIYDEKDSNYEIRERRRK
jgi:hypothetical protein